MEPLTNLLGKDTEVVRKRLETGKGILVVISSSDQRRRALFSALAHTLAAGLKNDLGEDLAAVAFVAAVFIDSTLPPELPTSILYSVVAENAPDATLAAIRAGTRHDPFALLVTTVTDTGIMEQLCRQSSMHLIIVGIDGATYPNVLTTALESTETTVPVLQLVDDGAAWHLG